MASKKMIFDISDMMMCSDAYPGARRDLCLFVELGGGRRIRGRICCQQWKSETEKAGTCCKSIVGSYHVDVIDGSIYTCHPFNQTKCFDVWCGDDRSEDGFLSWNWRQGFGKLPVLVFFMVSAESNLTLLHDLSPVGKTKFLDIAWRLCPNWRWFCFAVCHDPFI